jgi:O-antigen ligase
MHALFSYDTWSSLQTALPMLRFPIFAIAIAYFLKIDSGLKHKLFLILSIVLIFVAINATVQIAIGHDIFGNNLVQHTNFFRLTTPTGKQRIGYSCAFLVVPLIGYLLDMITNKRLSRISFYTIGVAIIMGLATIVFSGERMPLAVTLLSIFLGALSTDKFRRKTLIIFIVAAVLLTITIAAAPKLHYRIIGTTTAQINNFQKDAYGKIYHTAWLMFWDNKMFGIGPNQFHNKCPEFTENMDKDTVMCATHPHNFYLQMLSEGGVIGITLFTLAVILLFLRLYKNSYENYAKFAAILAFIKFIPIVPSASLYIAWSSGAIWFVIGLALSSAKIKPTALP